MDIFQVTKQSAQAQSPKNKILNKKNRIQYIKYEKELYVYNTYSIKY